MMPLANTPCCVRATLRSCRAAAVPGAAWPPCRHLQQSARGGSARPTEIAVTTRARATTKPPPAAVKSPAPGRTPERSSAGVLVVDADLRVRRRNERAAAWLGQGDDVASLFREAGSSAASRAGSTNSMRSVARERRDVWNARQNPRRRRGSRASSAPRPAAGVPRVKGPIHPSSFWSPTWDARTPLTRGMKSSDDSPPWASLPPASPTS